MSLDTELGSEAEDESPDLPYFIHMDSRLQLKTFLLVYTKEKYNPLKASLCVLTASSEQWSLPVGGEEGVLGPRTGLTGSHPASAP